MNWILNISVKQRLHFLTALSGVGLCLLVLLAVHDLSYMAEQNEKTFQELVELRAQCNADMHHDGLRGDFYASLCEKNLDAEMRAERMKEIQETISEFKRNIEDVRANASSPEIQAAVAQIQKPLAEYVDCLNTYIPMALVNPTEALLHKDEVDSRFKSLEGPMNDVSQRIEDHSAATKAAVLASSSSTRNVLIAISLCVLLIVFGFSYKVAGSITTPIAELSAASNLVSNGDTSVQLTVHSTDDLGTLTRDFNQMVLSLRTAGAQAAEEQEKTQQLMLQAERLREAADQQRETLHEAVQTMVVAMQRLANGDLTVQLQSEAAAEVADLYQGFNYTVQTLRSIVENVQHSIEETASASNQISSSTEEMAAGATEQASQTNDAVCAVEEMTKIIMETSNNARETALAAEAAKSSAEGGRNVILQTVDGMNRIAAGVQESVSTVKALGESSAQIGEIVVVISDIADQTNLLALNAAIEAARAGEQGRGFAVVADEVRKLAERTTKATREISEKIKRIQVETSDAVSTINDGTKDVESGLQLAREAGIALGNIVDAAQNVSGMIEHIAIAGEEQSRASEQISRNIEAIHNVTNETATATQQIARSAENLNRMTDNLFQLVGRFKLSDSDSQHSSSQTHKAQRSNDRDTIRRTASEQLRQKEQNSYMN